MIRTVKLLDGAVHFDAESTAAADAVNEVIGTPALVQATVAEALAISLALFEAHARAATIVSDVAEDGRRVVAIRVE